MKPKFIFHHDHYYHTLKSQIGSGIPVFHGVRQRGGGIGSVLGGIAKYALPLIAKFVLPHAKSAVANTVSDIAQNGLSLKQALKTNGVKFLKDVGSGVANSVLNNQSGSGITRKRVSDLHSLNSSRTKLIKTVIPPYRKKQSQQLSKAKKKKQRTRVDIFS